MVGQRAGQSAGPRGQKAEGAEGRVEGRARQRGQGRQGSVVKENSMYWWAGTNIDT